MLPFPSSNLLEDLPNQRTQVVLNKLLKALRRILFHESMRETVCQYGERTPVKVTMKYLIIALLTSPKEAGSLDRPLLFLSVHSSLRDSKNCSASDPSAA